MDTPKSTQAGVKVDLSTLLRPSGLNDLLTPDQLCDYRKNAYVYQPNEAPSSVYVIERGRVKIGTLAGNGKEVTKAVLQEGALFGESALFGLKARGDFAMAMDQTRLYVIPINLLQDKIRKDNRFCIELTMMIGDKLMRTEKRLESLIFKDARTRIVDYIREAAKEKGEQIGYETLIRNFGLTHQDIANLTGTSRQTVTTVLNELKEDNLIYLDRRNLLVRDMEKLH